MTNRILLDSDRYEFTTLLRKRNPLYPLAQWNKWYVENCRHRNEVMQQQQKQQRTQKMNYIYLCFATCFFSYSMVHSFSLCGQTFIITMSSMVASNSINNNEICMRCAQNTIYMECQSFHCYFILFFGVTHYYMIWWRFWWNYHHHYQDATINTRV